MNKYLRKRGPLDGLHKITRPINNIKILQLLEGINKLGRGWFPTFSSVRKSKNFILTSTLNGIKFSNFGVVGQRKKEESSLLVTRNPVYYLFGIRHYKPD